MFELIENRLNASADDSTVLAVVRKPADRPAVAASLNRDLARIQEWGNHLCMIPNPNKTKVLLKLIHVYFQKTYCKIYIHSLHWNTIHKSTGVA